MKTIKLIKHNTNIQFLKFKKATLIKPTPTEEKSEDKTASPSENTEKKEDEKK